MATVPNLLPNKLHPITGEYLAPTIVTTWRDGSPMTDALCGGLYNRDVTITGPNKYFKWNAAGPWPVSRLTTVNQANFQKLINDFGNSPATILIDKTLAITSNISIPSNIKLNWLPGSTLNISSSVVLTILSPIDEGNQLLFTGAGNVASNQQAANLKWFTVGDGTQDDTIGIQKALYYPNTLLGGSIKVPIGTYISETITVRKGITLIGESKEKSVFRLKANYTGDLFKLYNYARGGLYNLRLEGNKSNGAIGNAILIAADIDNDGAKSTASAIDNLFITDFKKSGIRAEAVAWIFTVRNNYIQFCDEYGIYNSTTDNAFYNNDISNCGFDGFYNFGGANTRIIGGKIISNGKSGLDVNYSGVHLESSNRCIIVGVECQDNYYHGFFLSNSEQNELIGVLSDGNNANSRAGVTTITGGAFTLSNSYGFKAYRAKDTLITGQASNYSVSAPSQYADRYFDSCSNIYYNVAITNQVTTGVELTSTNVRNLYENINPLNVNESFIMNWLSGIARIRLQNSSASFAIQTVANANMLLVDSSGKLTVNKLIVNSLIAGATTDAFVVYDNTTKEIKTIPYNSTKTVVNANNSAASFALDYFSDIPRLRIQGTGAGTSNGFAIQATGNTNLIYVDSSGRLYQNQYRLNAPNVTPSSATDTGTTGEIKFTVDGIYFCIGTNTWIGVPLVSNPSAIITQVKTASGTGAATTINIAHGLSYVPVIVSLIANNVASNVNPLITADATNFILTYAVAPASGTNNLSYNISYKK